jgi:hypothetical protein
VARADADRMLRKLPSRERHLIEAQFGLDGPAVPLAEVARGLGITSERARQIERRALDRLALQEEASTRTGRKPAAAACARDRGRARGGKRTSTLPGRGRPAARRRASLQGVPSG